VPTVLYKDGRSRPPHLRSWRDGWRHLRFMLLFSPRWMFLWPGAVCFALGLVASGLLMHGPLCIAGIGLDIHSLLVAGFLALGGYQLLVFGLFTKMYAVTEGFHPPHRLLGSDPHVNLEWGVLAGIAVGTAGLAVLGQAVWSWQQSGLGALDPQITLRHVIPA
ncbi:MAG TPA: glycosyltransferase family 2 protein, partial [Pirellulales bacterium]|nr:glycosyltransferase family 2 protein [Pirellulales bacterium]